MTFLTNLWSDLVEKRLWPVALALLVALVGVPVLLGGGGGEPAAALAPVGATGATGPGKPELLVALDAVTPARADRPGHVRDPFAQPGKAAAAKAAAGSAAGAPGVAGVPGSTIPTAPTASHGTAAAGSVGGGSPAATGTRTPAPSGTSGAPAPKAKAKRHAPAPPEPFLIKLRIGRRAGVTAKAKTVKRLTALPSADAPFLVALGVLSNRRTAVFELSADVQATGDGTCRPRPSSCETLELHAGDTERLAVTGDDGKVTTYRLRLIRIVTTAAARSPKAVAARHAAAKRARTAKEHTAGDAGGADAYTYDDASGLLRRVGSSAAVGAHLPAPAGSALPRAAPYERALPAKGLAALPAYSPGS